MHLQQIVEFPPVILNDGTHNNYNPANGVQALQQIQPLTIEHQRLTIEHGSLTINFVVSYAKSCHSKRITDHSIKFTHFQLLNT